MAPRSRLLDLERHDGLFFYGAYHQSDCASVATQGVVFWPVFLVAALLHLIAPFPQTAAVCGALYVTYCFLRVRDLPLLLRAMPPGAGRTLSLEYSGEGR